MKNIPLIPLLEVAQLENTQNACRAVVPEVDGVHHRRTAEGVASCFPNNLLGNEFNMCGKEGAQVCVVVGRRAQAPRTNGRSRLQRVSAGCGASCSTSGEEAMRSPRQAAPAAAPASASPRSPSSLPPLLLPPPSLPIFSPFPLSQQKAVGGRVPC